MAEHPYAAQSPAPATAPDAGATKDAVRARLRQQRREHVPGRDRAADAEEIELAALHAAHEEGVVAGDWVAAYESMPSEPPTDGLIGAMAARGIRVMVPITQPDWTLDWKEAGTDTSLGADAIRGARLLFVPAQAVDSSGMRIGRGKGCYDRTLPHVSARVVALVHPWEVLDEPLPSDAHDRPVDAVIAAGIGLRAFSRSTRSEASE
jgi:5-formyltetrahydrofolate cyclo-ligase